MPITTEIIQPNLQNHEAFVYKYTKLNAELGEKQFYVGFHKGTVDDDYSHTSTDDNLDLDIGKHDFKYEILHWGTMDEMRTKEHSILKSANARTSTEWYNKTTGAEGKSVKGINLPHISNMADEIIAKNSYNGVNAITKDFVKKTMRSVIKGEFQKIQPRGAEIVSSNVDKISSLLDKKGVNGNLNILKKQGVNLLVVVLEGIEVKKDDGTIDSRPIIVGGNHTIKGTLDSKHGRQIRFLILSKEQHGLTFNEAYELGSFLNKPKLQPGLTSDGDDLFKQCLRLCNNFGYNSQSEEIDECLDLNNEFDVNIRKKTKTKLTKALKKEKLANTMWKTYDSPEGLEEIEKRKAAILKKYPSAKVISASSGFCEPGKNLITMHKEIAAGIFYDKIIWVLHHPTPEVHAKYQTDYKKNNDLFVEMTCAAFVNKFKHIKEMDYMFLDMDTTKSDLN